ncbi:hypothetical protein KAFR_0B05530 [Kazachstania africana CBS 2517]|uniref:Glutamate pyruvate transaminase n=1 Tax=Kazachstania africana (strain ATCC 22294 / BCRC 22015 / CBS 2517 / CECT 1963 / NBRC 1671 / NRRL Y-8276) TaxID=1071382 RepID=H2AR48_KAZAF|nr:hypothetical protein KAFR_0B05530 [Kazachstania africana CBS 2517]CCF56848.1 hypothetical protein KAFR_0B05530 [Kazachstania africana CBS 2517]
MQLTEEFAATTQYFPVRKALDDDTIHNFKPAKKITLDDLNQNVLKSEYAVRGSIPRRAEELEFELLNNDSSDSLAFENIVHANIGNPQQLDQKPLTFSRQVISILQYPELLNQRNILVSTGIFKSDAMERAETLLCHIGGSVGAYSSSQGVYGIRETVANYITARDNGETASPDDIFLTEGASKAASYLLSLLCKDKNTGVLIPIPQYPLYTATITLCDAKMLPYYLNEESGWSTNTNEIEKVVLDAIADNVKPSVMVVINPGNPTGSVLSKDDIIHIINIGAKYGIVLIADEVYQENIFDGEFHSMKKVLRSLQKQYPGKYDAVQLASLHSTSKGVSGECGQRGGYMELVGFKDEIRQAILKLASISLCSVITGQALVDLMVNPPKKGDESYELDNFERKNIHETLKERAEKLYNLFCQLKGVECQKPQGAMYLFPKLHFPQTLITEAINQNMSPDEFYCHALLEATGICTVPGSGFGQKEGTYHLRTTFLAPGNQWTEKWKLFHEEFFSKYQ